MDDGFSNYRQWSDAWSEIEQLTSGGQASAKHVRDAASGREAFLKILSRQSDPERRARFFREATAYSTCSHPGLPMLIDSNSQHHSDADFRLYLATDFIAGPTLRAHVNINGARPLGEALETTVTLLRIAEYLHSSGWIHRDIKPDNIILKDGDPSAPILLDFGMAFGGATIDDHETEINQEVGNRFLRLPELSASSVLKRDSRSDLTFIFGIFFFLLTAEAPSTILDAEHRMPHQRGRVTSQLLSVGGSVGRDLLGIFDKAFQYRIADRWDEPARAISALDKLEIGMHMTEPENIDDKLKSILMFVNNDVNLRIRRHKLLYDQAMSHIEAAHNEISHSVAPIYHRFQSGYVNFHDGLKNTLGFCHFANQNWRFAPHFHIRVVGDELVITADEVVIGRTDAESPKFGEELRARLREIYIIGLDALSQEINPG